MQGCSTLARVLALRSNSSICFQLATRFRDSAFTATSCPVFLSRAYTHSNGVSRLKTAKSLLLLLVAAFSISNWLEVLVNAFVLASASLLTLVNGEAS